MQPFDTATWPAATARVPGVDLTDAVELFLQTIKRVSARPVVGKPYDGPAPRTGIADTPPAREWVMEIARLVGGVANLANLANWARVAARPGSDGFQDLGPRPDADLALAERIRHRLRCSARLRSQAVEVRVERGCTTLTGTVATGPDRELVANDAYRAGARHTTNELRVAAHPER